MKCVLQTVVFLVAVHCVVCQSNVTGYKWLFTTSPNEYKDFPLKFQKPLPKWLRGDWIKNGPAQFEMGHRKLRHVFDGFGKLSKFSFKGDGKTVTYTSKFLESSGYTKSVSEGDIYPNLLLAQPDPDFNIIEKLEQLKNGPENMNVNVYKFGKNYVSVSDTWNLYTFNATNLKTLKSVLPGITGIQMSALQHAMSSAHPMRLPGTNYWVNHALEVGLHSAVMNVVLIKSGTERQLITKFSVDKNYYMHSFGLTENYVIYFAHPCYFELMSLVKTAQLMKSIKFNEKYPTYVYVVSIKTGVVRKLTTEARFFLHVTNSYEVHSNADGKEPSLVVDFLTYDDMSAVSTILLENLLKDENRTNIMQKSQFKRYEIDLNGGTVTSKLLHKESYFDFPIINEHFRYKKYCYVYGINLDLNNTTVSALIKRDVCSGKRDLTWHVRNHYPSEPWFIPNPNGSREDDGILLDVVLDGNNGKSYLVLLDAKTMQFLDHAYLPNFIPFSLHGRLFD